MDYMRKHLIVEHRVTIKILEETSLQYEGTRIISNFYLNQRACVRLEEYRREQVKTTRGVRQGYSFSHLIDNLNSKKILNETFDGVREFRSQKTSLTPEKRQVVSIYMITRGFACLMKYEKTFDFVQHRMIIKLLEETSLHYEGTRIISNLYRNQSAYV
ncbi:hypothetical protein WA026_007627 [Henosepilachna vigintioctopunctata]|uniref:Uncharacterized protein n=1 Tax=Henosepilachna vigintioctopunctata TaxID=420089 RepID=A0AAW1TUM7_9CUCU